MRGTGRNSEKRRERSKVAARDRRSKESEIFSELSQYLPLPEPTRNALDKASVMRLSLSDLKLRTMMEKVFSSATTTKGSMNNGDGKVDGLVLELESLLNNAMGGFLLVLSTEGDIIYVSESVTTHLGLSQVEVMGLNIYDFSHPCDHVDIKELLVVNKKDSEVDNGKRSSSFRMKCTITERGRNVHIRAATYKVIDFTGRMLAGAGKNEESWFIGIGEPLLHPSDVDIPLNKQTFLTKHSPDMKCEFVDDSITAFLGYRPEDLIGKSVFEFYHASEGHGLAKSFKSLYVKGQCITERYRFLAKHGGWVWVVTQATLIQSNGGIKPNSVVCLNFITSGIENENEIVSSIQREQPACKPFKVTIPNFKNPQFVSAKSETVEKNSRREEIEKENILPAIPASNPVPSTTKIFAPRTEDMDTGFLMPCDNTLIVSKEEPDDLTHLAPIAGDESVPLDLPLLDNLLQSLDGANIKYTMNGYMIDVNLDDLPPLEEPFPKPFDESSSSPSPQGVELSSPKCLELDKTKDVIGGGGSPVSLGCSASPLFLQSDPHMVSSPGSKSSLLSPFQHPQFSPGIRSDKYDFGSPSSCQSDSSPHVDSGGNSSSDESVPGLINLNLQDSNHSAILQDRQWSSNNNRNPGSVMSASSISCSDVRSSSPIDLDFTTDDEISNYNSSNALELPIYDTATFETVPAIVDNDLLWQNDFNLMSNTNCDNFQFLFEIDKTKGNPTKFSNSNKQGTQCYYLNTDQQIRSPANNTIFDGMPKEGADKSWMDNRIRDSIPIMMSQKRPHKLLDVKQEVNENFSTSCYSSEPSVAKQPKLVPRLTTPPLSSSPSPGSLSLSSAKDTNSRNRMQPFGKEGRGGGISVGNNLTTRNYVPDTSNITNFNVESKSASVPTKTTSTTTTTIEPANSFSEIDLKAYVQNLLASGRNDIINELLNELSNYRKECSPNQPTVTPVENALTAESRVVEPPYSSAENNKPQISKKSKLEDSTADKIAKNSVLAIVGLCESPSEALVELTTLDCEVNAPANEGFSHLNASELVKVLDKDNPIDSFV